MKHLKCDHKVSPASITKLDNSIKEGPPMSIEPCKRKRTSPKITTPKKRDNDDFDLVGDILKSAEKLQDMK